MMNGQLGDAQTWVDLLNKEAGINSSPTSNGSAGITISSQTPRTNRKSSHRSEKPGENDVLRSQVVNLLKEKQEILKKAQVDNQAKKALEEELRVLKENQSAKTNGGHSVPSSNNEALSLEIQVSTLREALDSVTREKNLLRQQLSHRDKSNVNCSPKSSSSITSEEDFSLRLQLSQLKDTLYRVERERDALKARINGLDTQRQESMEQYQLEVESSMLEVTNQLEELLQLNQQLQAELTTVQQEKEDLAQLLQQERVAKQQWEKEKVALNHRLEGYEVKTVTLNNELQSVKDEMLQQTTSSLTAIETLQSQVSSTSDSNSQMKVKYDKSQTEITRLRGEIKRLEKNRNEADHALIDLQHHLTLARQENDSLKTRLQSSQSQVSQLKKEVKASEERSLSSESVVSRLQRDVNASTTDLTLVKKQMNNTEMENKRLTKELSVAQKHCKQQVENLTQQLMHKATSLSELETDKAQLQSRIKKLESKIHEMALNHEMESSQREDSLRNTMTTLDSTMVQLETAESTNTQLQQKILDLEEEVTGWRKQLTERETACQELRELIEEKNQTIHTHESTIATLHQDLANASSGSNSDQHNNVLLSQINSLKKSLRQIQIERDQLSARLEVELDRNKSTSQSETSLREKNSKLQDLLNTSLSLNEKHLSLDSTTHSSTTTPLSSPDKSPSSIHQAAVTTGGEGGGDSTPLQYSPITQYTVGSSPSTEVIHLKQLLTEGRQACLSLQRQHAQDKTEMAKVQGSLQALLQIQNHLSSENKSVSEELASVNEEKDAYKLESMKLSGELVSVQKELEGLTILLAQFKQRAVIKVAELTETLEAGCGLHVTLVELLSDLQDCEELSSLKIYDEVLEAFCKYFSETDSNEDGQQVLVLRDSLQKATDENVGKTRDIESLRRNMAEVCKQVEMLEQEVQKQRELLSVKEEELTNCRREIEELHEEQLDNTNDNSVHVEYIKDIDAKYQAKIDVLREKLIEREEEVSTLTCTVMELKERLSTNEDALQLLRTDTEDKRQEDLELKTRLARCETTLRTEVALLDNEVTKQIDDISEMTKEAKDIEDAWRSTANINTEQQEQLTKCTDHISQLQAEVEMLRAKKTVISKYLSTQESSGDDQTERERQELIQENDHLSSENEELRQELSNLVETTEHLNELIEVLRLRLEEVQEEYSEQILKEGEEGGDSSSLKLQLEQLQDQLKEQYQLLEMEKYEVKKVENERDMKEAEVTALERRMELAQRKHTNELNEVTNRLQEQEETVIDLRDCLTSVREEKELLQQKLMNSSITGDNCVNKINKLKMKLKQQTKQCNHLRMKLGYSISELRLHKQLKSELDSQIAQLQKALTLSQQQNKQCLNKLVLAEQLVTSSIPSDKQP